MKAIQGKQPSFEQPKAVMMLDDAEMALTLAELAEAASAPVAPAKRVERTALSLDAVCELRSAACLVLGCEEAEALQRELDQALRVYQPKKAA